MGAAVTLAEDSLAVDPGSRVGTEVRVRNTGEVVDQFSFEALGPGAPWASFEPSVLSLLPDTDGVVEIQFAPPRQPSTTAGTVPFGVRVSAQEDPAGSAVAEGDLTIGRYEDIVAELAPRTTRGRFRGRHELAVQNRQNVGLQGRLVGVDPDRRLDFTFTPPEASARPGSATVAIVDVRPHRRFLRGPSVTHTYTVRIVPPDQAHIEMPGAFLQEALIPRWVPRALLALAALIAAWFLLLRPTVESAARNAVEDQVKEASQLAASQAVAPALNAMEERLDKVEATATAEAKADGPPTTTTTPPPPSEPFDVRLTKPTAREDTAIHKVPSGKTLSVTDLVFENARGDKGTVSLLRGDDVLLSVVLETFRDLDYHFVSPLVFPPDSELKFRVQCANGPPPRECTPAVTVAGFTRGEPGR